MQALHTLVLADRYNALALKDAALNQAADHLKTLRQRPEWKEFADKHRGLVGELMGVLADKLEKANASLAERQPSRQKCRKAKEFQPFPHVPPYI